MLQEITRRLFFKGLSALGFGIKLFPVNPLPVVKFDAQGDIANYKELFKNVPFECGNIAKCRCWNRKIDAWVEEKDALLMPKKPFLKESATLCWGKVKLTEEVMEIADSLMCSVHICSTDETQIKSILNNANLYFQNNHPHVKELTKNLR